MRKFANLFILLFLLVPLLRLVELLWPGDGALATLLLALHGWAELLALLCALGIFFAFPFDRHLPKLLFWPLILALLWGCLDFWPLERILGEGAPWVAACGQLLLGLLVILRIRSVNGRSWLLRRSQFAGPGFTIGNFLKSALFNLALFPVLLTLLAFSATATLVEQGTAGFVRLKPDGLYMVERSYRRSDRTIRLAAMIHLGGSDYFRELAASLQGPRTLVLAEGVRDEDQLLGAGFSYRPLAEGLGLAAQESFPFAGRLVTPASLHDAEEGVVIGVDLLPADIDLKQFDARTIALLNAIGRYVLNADSLLQGWREFNRWAAEHVDPDVEEVLMEDLIERRNRALLAYLPPALEKYRTLVIPWGALHMPGIEAGVLDLDFRHVESGARKSIDFASLPWRNWAERLRQQAFAPAAPSLSRNPPPAPAPR